MCPLCFSNDIGAEKHYIFHCTNPKLVEIRKTFIPEIYEIFTSYPNVNSINDILHIILRGSSNASVSSKHQHPPPRATPGVLHSTAAPGPGFILDEFLHIHKITFSTVKKYTFTQLPFGSYLHALHRQFRLSILA